MPIPQPQWPALLQQQGCDELLPLPLQADWQKYQLECRHLLCPGDVLIDATLTRFTLTEDHSLLADGAISTAELTQLLRAHLATQGHCCLAKLQLNSLADAIELISALDS
ncbi:DUF4144 family protein [Shewanella khirikhana]|uniref:Uncharacterized protein n=1 Tax=Shewanella khirikhana TaxID=1965282 RepID=A0ABM7CYR9_9GAMM|nr:DUF4144 family protein [Shewanella khirikhana]AZQ09252.1 hypothetical protein STH12_00100 [Shewanella khirikhana]